MIRFIAHLLKLSYEPCKGCETLKNQLAIANEEKKEILDTLMNVVNPQAVPAERVEPARAKAVARTFTQKRVDLEARSRMEAITRVTSPFIGKSDDKKTEDKVIKYTVVPSEDKTESSQIDELEKELAIGEQNG